MTPEEWKAGMENEAKSVKDTVWARETRLAAASPRPLTWALMTLAFTAFTLVFNALSDAFMVTHPALFMLSQSQRPGVAQNLLPWPGLMLIFFLSYVMGRRSYPLPGIATFFLGSFLLGGLISRLITIPFKFSESSASSEINVYMPDLLPSAPVSWDTLTGLLLVALPVALGLLTARLNRRRA